MLRLSCGVAKCRLTYCGFERMTDRAWIQTNQLLPPLFDGGATIILRIFLALARSGAPRPRSRLLPYHLRKIYARCVRDIDARRQRTHVL
jgi:hypothetical protein